MVEGMPRLHHVVTCGLLGCSSVACVEIDPSYGESYSPSGTMGPATGSSTDTGSSGADDGSAGSGPAVDLNVAFVTSAQYTAALGGLAGADEKCQMAAGSAGLPGTFVAWLGDASTSAAGRLGNASGWVRTDGLVFATDRDALLSGRASYPLMLTETGTPVSGNGFAYVFTGAQGIGGAGVPDDCGSWSLTDPAQYGQLGYTDAVGGWWSSGVSAPCDFMAHLFCLGIDADAPVQNPAPAADARLMFETTGTITADAGREVADQMCADEAGAAGLSGTFLALMAVPGEALFDRHALGGDWVRPDGAVVLPGSGSPATWGQVLSPPVLDVDGGLASSAAFWSGVVSSTEAATDATTCMGWTDATAIESPIAWTLLIRWLEGQGTATCEGARGVLCLEQ